MTTVSYGRLTPTCVVSSSGVRLNGLKPGFCGPMFPKHWCGSGVFSTNSDVAVSPPTTARGQNAEFCYADISGFYKSCCLRYPEVRIGKNRTAQLTSTISIVHGVPGRLNSEWHLLLYYISGLGHLVPRVTAFNSAHLWTRVNDNIRPIRVIGWYNQSNETEDGSNLGNGTVRRYSSEWCTWPNDRKPGGTLGDQPLLTLEKRKSSP